MVLLMFYIVYIDEYEQKNIPKECYECRFGLSLLTLKGSFLPTKTSNRHPSNILNL